MRAAYIESFDPDDPASVVRVGDRPEPETPAGWVAVDVRAATLNHHDVWSARGVGLTEEQLPMILGCDAAGVDPDGREVVVHAAVNDPAWVGPEELDPKLRLLSEGPQGALAERVAVPPATSCPSRRAELRGGGLPADGVAHGLPDAVHARASSARARRCSSRAPRAASRPR